MARAIWKGSINFGLVNIPIKLYSAIEQPKTRMHLHHEKDGGKIRQKKWCETCKSEVTQDEIIKGVMREGQIVTVGADELKQIRPEKTSWIKVTEFIPSHQIEPFYYSAHYYLGAELKKDKTFFLFRNALRQCGKTAIARFVMKEKEHVCAIQAYGDGLLLSTLNYNEEVRDISEIANIKEEPEISDEEMKLARLLIDQKSVEELDMSQFIDEFAIGFEELVSTKARGEAFVAPEVTHVSNTGANLVDELKASLCAVEA